jgi:hypothetical protein
MRSADDFTVIAARIAELRKAPRSAPDRRAADDGCACVFAFDGGTCFAGEREFAVSRATVQMRFSVLPGPWLERGEIVGGGVERQISGSFFVGDGISLYGLASKVRLVLRSEAVIGERRHVIELNIPVCRLGGFEQEGIDDFRLDFNAELVDGVLAEIRSYEPEAQRERSDLIAKLAACVGLSADRIAEYSDADLRILAESWGVLPAEVDGALQSVRWPRQNADVIIPDDRVDQIKPFRD